MQEVMHSNYTQIKLPHCFYLVTRLMPSLTPSCIDPAALLMAS